MLAFEVAVDVMTGIEEAGDMAVQDASIKKLVPSSQRKDGLARNWQVDIMLYIGFVAANLSGPRCTRWSKA